MSAFNLIVALSAVSIYVSLCLIARLWFTHRKDPILRKIFWSLVLMIPLAGWIFYGGFYRPPHRIEGALLEHSAHFSGTAPGEGGHF